MKSGSKNKIKKKKVVLNKNKCYVHLKTKHKQTKINQRLLDMQHTQVCLFYSGLTAYFRTK